MTIDKVIICHAGNVVCNDIFLIMNGKIYPSIFFTFPVKIANYRTIEIMFVNWRL